MRTDGESGLLRRGKHWWLRYTDARGRAHIKPTTITVRELAEQLLGDVGAFVARQRSAEGCLNERS